MTLEYFYEGVKQGRTHVLLAASVFYFRILSIIQVKEYQYLKDREIYGNNVTPQDIAEGVAFLC